MFKGNLLGKSILIRDYDASCCGVSLRISVDVGLCPPSGVGHE